MPNQFPKPTSTSRSSRIIRSRQGASSCTGWLSQAHSPSTAAVPSPSEPSSPEISDYVYLEVFESESSTRTKLFKCQRKAAMMSTLLADMLNQNDILSGKTEKGCPVLPLGNLYCAPGAIELIIGYCEYHCDDPITEEQPSNNYRSFDELDEERDNESKYEIPCYWDRSFIQSVAGATLTAETRANLYDLLIAAHYLGIDRLVELGAKHICKQITGKGCDEVRAILNIGNDLDPSEERRIHEENAWANSSATQTKTAQKKK